MYSRSRSRSPVRREKKRSRSRSPRRHRSRSPKRKDRDRYSNRESKRQRSPRSKQGTEKEPISSSNASEKDKNYDDETSMMQMMGFAAFDSTKGKHVEGQMEGTVKIEKSKKYRQYMNRRGGFNRPLDYVT